MKKKQAAVTSLLFLLLLGLFFAYPGKDNSHGAAPVMETLQRGGETYYLYLEGQVFSLFSAEGDLICTYDPGAGRVVLSWCVSDLDGDGQEKVLFVSGEDGFSLDGLPVGDTLIILDFQDYFREIFRQSFSVLNPWKVLTGDVDGDGRMEISLGVYKEAPFHPVMAKRPFIYDWQEDGLVPKWRGSRLFRPFTDYIFADLDGNGRDELIAVELLENGQKVLQAYSWKGFGFEGVGESAPFTDIQDLQRNYLDYTWAVQALVKEGDKATLRMFCFDGEHLTERK